MRINFTTVDVARTLRTSRITIGCNFNLILVYDVIVKNYYISNLLLLVKCHIKKSSVLKSMLTVPLNDQYTLVVC
jgi:hypothetical protein